MRRDSKGRFSKEGKGTNDPMATWRRYDTITTWKRHDVQRGEYGVLNVQAQRIRELYATQRKLEASRVWWGLAGIVFGLVIGWFL